MNKQLFGFALSAIIAASTLPALAACPCNPCESCQIIHKTAGTVNYDKSQKRTNFGVIKKERKLSKFEKLIKKAGLREKVDKGNYTVFAPTNEAFDRMDQGRLQCLEKKENKDQLVKFVLSHMTEGDMSAQCLCEQEQVTNLNCCDHCVTKCCDRLKIGNACIIAPNVNTETGTIHIIDNVLEPYS